MANKLVHTFKVKTATGEMISECNYQTDRLAVDACLMFLKTARQVGMREHISIWSTFEREVDEGTPVISY